MHYGVSWYPEHKSEADFRHDLDLLIASGINTVRMGEFAWCRFEPTPGKYVFGWLDEAIDALGKAGIQTILCTPTACPPAWLIEKHPDILYMDGRGVRRPFGGRRHYCYNNPDYRRYSAAITEQIAARYGKHPYVKGFQIDNEPAQEGTGRCCCPVCAEAFRDWLKNKYGAIEELNRRSGGVFWSQEYTSFAQIQPPVNQIEPGAQTAIQAFYENPAIRLDFERFSSEAQVAYQDIQTRILKKHSAYPVTTNGTGLATNSIDYYHSSRELDVYAFDYYPNLRDARVDSFPYAFARGIKNGAPFWVLEFMSGGGHRFGGSGRMQPNPGALRQAVVHSMAHGAEMMLHFQFRTFPFGAEQLNYAIVDMDGVPRRRYQEMRDTAATLEKLRPYETAAFANEAALLVNYDSHWALRIKPVNNPLFNYFGYAGAIYQSLARLGVGADVLSTDMDFSGYKLVILPAAIILEESLRPRLKAYVEAGGILLATFLTSVKNADNYGYTEPLPAGLTDLFGVSVQELEPVFKENTTALRLELPEGEILESHDAYWSELLAGDANFPGRYTETYKQGSGVLSRKKCGAGEAWYLGTALPEPDMRILLQSLCKQAGIQSAPFRFGEPIEVVARQGEKPLYYLFNFSAAEAGVQTLADCRDVLSEEKFSASGNITLEPHGFRLLEMDGKENKA